MGKPFVPYTYLLAALVFIRPGTAAHGQTILPEVTLKLTAKVDGERFVGIDAHNLNGVQLVPGDRVEVRFERGSDFDAELWSRRYTWEKTEKRGKKKIITTMTKDAEVTWRATWGAGVEGVLTLGKDAVTSHGVVGEQRVPGVLLSKLVNGAKAEVKIADKVPAASLQLIVKEPDRDVDRPIDVPANAQKLTSTPREDQPPKVDVLVTQGADLGRVVLRITRPAATK